MLDFDRDETREQVKVKIAPDVEVTLNALEVNPSKYQMLGALQNKPTYSGSVSIKVKAKRRIAGKAAKQARKANR